MQTDRSSKFPAELQFFDSPGKRSNGKDNLNLLEPVQERCILPPFRIHRELACAKMHPPWPSLACPPVEISDFHICFHIWHSLFLHFWRALFKVSKEK